jgi:hypothetical protein
MPNRALWVTGSKQSKARSGVRVLLSWGVVWCGVVWCGAPLAVLCRFVRHGGRLGKPWIGFVNLCAAVDGTCVHCIERTRHVIVANWP